MIRWALIVALSALVFVAMPKVSGCASAHGGRIDPPAPTGDGETEIDQANGGAVAANLDVETDIKATAQLVGSYVSEYSPGVAAVAALAWLIQWGAYRRMAAFVTLLLKVLERAEERHDKQMVRIIRLFEDDEDDE